MRILSQHLDQWGAKESQHYNNNDWTDSIAQDKSNLEYDGTKFKTLYNRLRHYRPAEMLRQSKHDLNLFSSQCLKAVLGGLNTTAGCSIYKDRLNWYPFPQPPALEYWKGHPLFFYGKSPGDEVAPRVFAFSSMTLRRQLMLHVCCSSDSCGGFAVANKMV